MIFDSRTYSALVVSSSEKMSTQISGLLTSFPCYPVVCVGSISAAKREVLEKTFDFIIINSPLPDEMGTRFALDVSNNPHSVCLMLLKAEDYEDIESKVCSGGVFTLAKPLSTHTFTVALNWMKASRERIRKIEKKALSLEDKMEEIRLVNRAKWILIDKENMTETEAHKYIEKQAMDACATKTEIANIIISKHC